VVLSLLVRKTMKSLRYEMIFLGSVIGSVSGLYRGMRETRELTGSVRTSS
jgi:hypothetical protein